MVKFVLILSFFTFTSFSNAAVKINSYHKNDWKDEWSKAITTSIDSLENNKLVDEDINEDDLEKLGCPDLNYATDEEKKDFWIVFFSALARSESGLNERAKSPRHRGHRSYGLLQLAKDTAKKHCDLDSLEEEILDGEDNLSCGVSLLNWQLSGAPTPKGKKLRSDLEGNLFGKNILLWGPLRERDKNGRKRLYQWFNAHLDQLPFCDL